MISLSRHRWLIVAAVNAVTLFLLEQANHYLARFGLEIFAVGMLVSFCSLELNYRQGVLALAPIALTIDSRIPLPFGFCFMLTLTLFSISHLMRSRVRREVTASALATSLLLNGVAFAAFTFGAARYLGAEALYFGPLLLNLFLSLVVVTAVNRLFFELQYGVLALFGVHLAEEQREAR